MPPTCQKRRDASGTTCRRSCRQSHQDGRLHAVQSFIEDGGLSLFTFCIYAPSGTKWEPAKHRYLHDMLSALHEDVVRAVQLLHGC